MIHLIIIGIMCALLSFGLSFVFINIFPKNLSWLACTLGAGVALILYALVRLF